MARGKGRAGAGRRWAKVEEMGTFEIVSVIKTKEIKEKTLKTQEA